MITCDPRVWRLAHLGEGVAVPVAAPDMLFSGPLAANRSESPVESVVVYGAERTRLFDVMLGRR